MPKTPIHDGDCGYFAMFLDSEGNRVGLYSAS
jgi:predicted enzyme related to lactoylglutathione lyase